MKKKVAFLGVILAVAIILGYVESLIPFAFGIPGMKLGLPNLAILLCLYLYGNKEALLINISRIILCSLIFSNMYALLFSLSGAIASYICMILLKKCKHFSIIGVSIAGGICHNIGQVIVAYLVTDTKGILFYLPVLILGGTVTGMLLGILAKMLLTPIQSIIKSDINTK